MPLSFAQQRLWFLHELDPSSGHYNMPAALEFHGELDLPGLQKALDFLVSRHETLRTTYRALGEQPVQLIQPAAPVTLRMVELPLAAADDGSLQRLLVEESARPFNLQNELMLRPVLYKLGPTRSVLLLNMHHIASDEWSLQVLVRELSVAYNAVRSGQEINLPALPIRYADYAQWQRKWLQGDPLKKQLNYWRTKLEGPISLLELPLDHARPAVQTYHGAWRRRVLPLSLQQELKSLAAQEGMTFFMLLLAAFKTLLWRYTQTEDILVGSPVAGRTRLETENLVGFFVNTLILRTRISAELTFLEFLRRVRETTLGAYAHQDLPFEKLVEDLHPGRDSRHAPFTTVLFSVQNEWSGNFKFAGVDARPLEVNNGTAKFDLTLFARDSAEGLVCSVEYNTDLFETETIDKLLGHFGQLLQGIAANPRQGLATLPLLTKEEERTVFEDWNRTGTEYPRQEGLARIFERQAKATPDKVAAIYETQKITYAVLNERANQLGRYLRKFQIGPDSLVGLMVERSVDMLTGMLGILKAGGAYVPLDLSYPKERLAFMLEDAGISVLLTQRKLLEELPTTDCRVICLDHDWESIENESLENLPANATGDNLAYVIYTSGSTGKPKGVPIPQRGVSRVVLNTNYLQLTAEDRVAQVSNASFDAATFEIWGALLNGGCLVGVTRDVALSPKDFARTLEDQKISTLFLTTALFNQLAVEAPGAYKGLKYLLFGGEAVDVRRVQDVLRDGPPQHLLHVYGPTESTTFATAFEVKQIAADSELVPIGRPIANTEAWVLDPQLQLLPAGVPGELYLGGDGLARGYFHRPDLTAEKFVPHPFRNAAGAFIYKTGDRVRQRADGNIEFLGRFDFQVKIRGFRIELGEIEAVLCAHPLIREAVVIATGTTDKRLVAYLVATREQLAASELRAYLVEKLPDYMIPAHFMYLEALPLTPNGKIDRKHLPEADASRPQLEKSYLAPRDPVERQLVRIWENVLGIHPVGTTDNFFDLGGHSLLAIRLFTQIEKTFAQKLPLASLFQAPTVEQLANLLRKGNDGASWSLLVEIQPKGAKPPIFWVHSLGGDGGGAFFYYRKLASLLGPDQPSYGIRSPREPFTSIEQMAKHYISAIKVFQPEGPYYLGGFCFGGNVAYEMARQLTESGEKVGFLALLESEPANVKKNSSVWNLEVLKSVAANVMHWVAGICSDGSGEFWTRVQRRTRRIQRKVAGLFEKGEAKQVALADRVDMSNYPKDYVKYAEAHWQALLHFAPKPYPGSAVLFRAQQQSITMMDPTLGWGGLIKGGLTVKTIPGTHEKMLEEPNVNILAKQFTSLLEARRQNEGRD